MKIHCQIKYTINVNVMEKLKKSVGVMVEPPMCKEINLSRYYKVIRVFILSVVYPSDG